MTNKRLRATVAVAITMTTAAEAQSPPAIQVIPGTFPLVWSFDRTGPDAYFIQLTGPQAQVGGFRAVAYNSSKYLTFCEAGQVVMADASKTLTVKPAQIGPPADPPPPGFVPPTEWLAPPHTNTLFTSDDVIAEGHGGFTFSISCRISGIDGQVSYTHTFSDADIAAQKTKFVNSLPTKP